MDSALIGRFFAWGNAPGVEALDTLAQPWNFRLAYAFFPPLLLCVIWKIAVSSGVFLLVTPFWLAQRWFPAILGLRVMDVRRLPTLPAVINLTSGSPPLPHLPLLVRRVFGDSEISPSQKPLRLICVGWRPSSAAQYGSVWHSFGDFLIARGVLLLLVNLMVTLDCFTFPCILSCYLRPSASV